MFEFKILTNSYMTDEQAWFNTNPRDLWIFDKLILAKRLGYTCGPKGVDVPRPGIYIVRPITNINGMGLGVQKRWIDDSTDDLPDGSFWCEVFKGRHISVDYYKGVQSVTVEGFYRADGKFEKWVKVSDKIPLPNIITKLNKFYEYINIEMIDSKIIEVHLRLNPDFEGHNSDVLYPVWKGDNFDSTRKFISRPDGERLGFYLD